MTLWSLGRLNPEISKSNVSDIPNVRDLRQPLSFSRSIILIGQGCISAELVTIGEDHINPSLSEVNEGNVVFYLNHIYNLKGKGLKVKLNQS